MRKTLGCWQAVPNGRSSALNLAYLALDSPECCRLIVAAGGTRALARCLRSLLWLIVSNSILVLTCEESDGGLPSGLTQPSEGHNGPMHACHNAPRAAEAEEQRSARPGTAGGHSYGPQSAPRRLSRSGRPSRCGHGRRCARLHLSRHARPAPLQGLRLGALLQRGLQSCALAGTQGGVPAGFSSSRGVARRRSKRRSKRRRRRARRQQPRRQPAAPEPSVCPVILRSLSKQLATVLHVHARHHAEWEGEPREASGRGGRAVRPNGSRRAAPPVGSRGAGAPRSMGAQHASEPHEAASGRFGAHRRQGTPTASLLRPLATSRSALWPVPGPSASHPRPHMNC